MNATGMTVERLKATADGFLREEGGRTHAFLISARLKEWHADEAARLGKLLEAGAYLRPGRTGSKTKTIARRVRGKDLACYPIRLKRLRALLDDKPMVLSWMHPIS